jgi:DNA polymerase III subunit alpha
LKIVQRRSLGFQPVYDLGLAQDHNFVVQSGLVASNCFNKSHSTAYGYVTYQTAYLKANYPVEYMAALLTANSGDQDKMPRYINTCLNMGIGVEPPHINQSGVDFTPLENSILFGLSAVRNVGQGAIENILAAREEKGEFGSLADLCDRIDPKVVNRRALEALIHCGAMDCLDINRNQLIQDLDLILDWVQSRARDRAVGQGNLFDMMSSGSSRDGGTSTALDSAPKAAAVEDFLEADKLKFEKDLLGLYLSNHPLREIEQPSRLMAPVSLSNLETQADNITLSAIVLLTEVKPIMTKKGDRMAIVQLEDLTGKAEAVIFPKSFERISQHIAADRRLMVWGKVDRRDERTQFIIEDAEPIEEVRFVMVEIPAQDAANIQRQQHLKEVLRGQIAEGESAKVAVVAKIRGASQNQLVRLGVQFRVPDETTAVTALNNAGFKASAYGLLQNIPVA